MEPDDLIELKREFVINQTPDLANDLSAFLAKHPIFSALPAEDREIMASAGAVRLLLAIPSESVVGLVR